MKQYSLFIFFSILVSGLWSQQLIPDKSLHDFGIVHENAGKVLCDFTLDNKSPDIYLVRGVISSCGCTAIGITQDTIAPNAQIKLSVSYETTGRPGKFFKQASLVLKPMGSPDTVVLDFYIKGNVLSKDEVNYTPQDFSKAVIQIKPLTFIANDLNEQALSDFINDLTYVIDKDGFVNIGFECTTVNTDQLNQLKKKIKDGLIYRGYQQHSVGFSTKPLSNSTSEVNTITISVVGYSNNEIHSSQILLRGYNYLGHNTTNIDSMVSLHRFTVDQDVKKIDFKNKRAISFLDAITRQVLISKAALVKSTINGVAPDRMDFFMREFYSSYIQQIKAEISESGIDINQVVFLSPVFTGIAKKSTQFDIVQPIEVEQVSWFDFQAHLDSLRLIKTSNQQEVFRNNVPVFYQRVFNTSDLDTSDIQFKQWFNLLVSKLQQSPNTRILIEATASNSPTTKKYNNDYVARRRLKSTTDILVNRLRKSGFADPEKLVVKTYSMVKGPLYHEQDFLVQHYNKYQYVKIMTIEQDEKGSGSIQKPVPYSINFNNNALEIPYDSPVFLNFINGLIPYLNANGYIELLLESSSSKVPTKDYRSNRVLAFERLQKAKDAIQKAVAEKGYNPLRVIFTEERILVQGPAFNEQLDPKSEYFKDFQYVKIIPQLLVR